MIMSLDFMPLHCRVTGHLLQGGWAEFSDTTQNTALPEYQKEWRLGSILFDNWEVSLNLFASLFIFISVDDLAYYFKEIIEHSAAELWNHNSHIDSLLYSASILTFHLVTERDLVLLCFKSYPSTKALLFHFLSDCPFSFVTLLSLSKGIPNLLASFFQT